ncbi:MAG: S-layer homology domain-containing protein, partial [Oscillospiraceae bacterium]|nr:S-layer homology domain-containing protein [Oscillospiraceae bacterium]
MLKSRKILAWALALALVCAVFPMTAPQVYAAEAVEPVSYPAGGLLSLKINERPESMAKLPTMSSAKAPRAFAPLAAADSTIPGGTRHGYNELGKIATYSTTLQAIYTELVTYAEKAYQPESVYTEVSIQGELYYTLGLINLEDLPHTTVGAVSLAFWAFRQDNPQYYVLAPGFSLYLDARTDMVVEIAPYLFPDYAAAGIRASTSKLAEERFQEYADVADRGATDAEKARLVHDKMLAECDYSYINGQPDENAYAHNIMGVLDLSTPGPVCEAYAHAYAYILTRLGIPALIVSGAADTGDGELVGHAWNMVQIGGAWYYVDPTFNDFEATGNRNHEFNDEGNTKNALYFKYYMVGSGNSAFTGRHFPGSSAPVDDPPNGFHQAALPAASVTDLVDNGSVKWLTNNPYYNMSYNYSNGNGDYYIAMTDKLGHENKTAPYVTDGLFTTSNGSSFYFNDDYEYSFGSYTVAKDATDVPVTGRLYEWDYADTDYITGMFKNPTPLTQGTDYEIIVEKPLKQGKNRAYVYGIGGYRGIDFAMIDLTFGDASATVGDVTVTGAVNAGIPEPNTLTITLTNAHAVREGLNNADASSWFTGLAAGMTATANAGSFASEITVTFGGVPTEPADAAFGILIPETAQTSGAALAVTANAAAKLVITGTASTPVTEDVEPEDFDVDAAAQFGEAQTAVRVTLPGGVVTLQPDALTALAKMSDNGATPITLELSPAAEDGLTTMQAAQVKGLESAVRFRVFVGEEETEIPAEISLPYTLKDGENAKAVRVWHISGNGNLKRLGGTYADGVIAFKASPDQNLFAVGYDPVALWENIFTDISPDAWYYDAVAYANFHGYVDGSNNLYDPDGSLSRAEFVTLIWKLEGGPAAEGANPFDDIPDGTWYTDAVIWAASNNIVSGTGTGYNPGKELSRQEMVTMLHNYLTFKGYDIPLNQEVTYEDSGEVSPWAAEAVTS